MRFVLTSSATSDCISLNSVDDDFIETTEYFDIKLVQGSTEVRFVNDTASIGIIDDDCKQALI